MASSCEDDPEMVRFSPMSMVREGEDREKLCLSPIPSLDVGDSPSRIELSPVPTLKEELRHRDTPKRICLSPLPTVKGSPRSPRRSRSPRLSFTSMELKKRLLSPAASVDTKEHLLSPDPDQTPAKTKMQLLSPSKFSRESINYEDYLPKFSPRIEKSDNPEPNAKAKRRSVLEASQHGQKRIASIKAKQAEGLSTMRDIIESPSAQENGAFTYEAENGAHCVEQIPNAKAKRRSVMEASLHGQKRLSSIKRKQADGLSSMRDVVESPSAQEHGAFTFETEDEVRVVVDQRQKKDKRRSDVVQTQPYAQSRIRSAKEKEKKGMLLSDIIQSPSAKANGAALSPFLMEDEGI